MTHTVEHEAEMVNVYATEEIVGAAPTDSDDYLGHYQPVYEDTDKLTRAVEILQAMEGVTRPRDIDAVQERLTLLAEGKIREPIIITGRCSEDIVSINERRDLVSSATLSIDIVRQGLGKAIHFLRAAGQDVKPRSAATETLLTGATVPSFMGPAVNSPERSSDARRPDPMRMLASADQAAALAQGINAETGQPAIVAHEVLLLTREKAFVRIDPESGKPYMLSAVMGWVGKRTNQLDSEPVQLMKGCANPVGVKIGANSDAEHIAGLQAALNPDNIPGRLTFMLRIGREERQRLTTITEAIAKYTTNALVMYDIHGTTRTVEGRKVRAVSDVIEDIAMVSESCYQSGVMLHGIHLETTTDDTLECVDTPEQIPTHKPLVDPLLNQQQTAHILETVKREGYLLRYI